MSGYEYKTVALPNAVEGKLRRRQTEAELIAETLGETLRAEAVDGWEYMRAETLIARSRPSMFSRAAVDTPYTVLIFRRVVDAVWRDPQGRQREGSDEALVSMPRREKPAEPAAPPAPVVEAELKPPVGSARD